MTNDLHILVGLGTTAISCAKFLSEKNIPIALTDTRNNPPLLEQFKKTYPDIPMQLGKLDNAFLEKAAKLIVSPGISIKEPAIAQQSEKGIEVLGDIELFARVANAPIIAITGTNAKSTVTTLVGLMAQKAGLKTYVGGNLGTPALDLLHDDAQAYVLELSSFQLETTFSLKPRVATILNITPDHMDRYSTLGDYTAAKHRIYENCEIAVCNRDDAATEAQLKNKFYFTLNRPNKNEFGIIEQDNLSYLAFENKLLMPVNELPVLGKHYQANALASLALGYAFGLALEPMIDVLREFKGLTHRCQLIKDQNQIRWYNDSKGTNVGATLAAIEGLGPVIDGKLILIAGGQGKNADFSALIKPIAKFVREVILIGEAAPLLNTLLKDHVKIHFAGSMQEAVELANQSAKPGDSVLLSPACASYDMFKNFEHRGNVFTEAVQGMK